MSGFLNTKEKLVSKVTEIPTERIFIAHPATDFSEDDIRNIADNILRNGMLQPVSVKKSGDFYELIAGEKRFIASKMCGLKTVPCVIIELNDRNSAIVRLVDDIKYRNISFFDEAEAIEKLITQYGLTQEDTARKLGKAQSTIANKLRLLRLTPPERELITKYGLTERHSRALLRLGSAEDRLSILDKVIKNKLNVERTELLIDDYIGSQREKANYKKRVKNFQNVGIFLSTINKAVETMKDSGIIADSKKIQSDDYIEYRVRIPIQKDARF